MKRFYIDATLAYGLDLFNDDTGEPTRFFVCDGTRGWDDVVAEFYHEFDAVVYCEWRNNPLAQS